MANRNQKIRTKMPTSQRAKQFMPFAAVTGLETALQKVREEHEKLPMRAISEETVEGINRILCTLKKGDVVEITHYIDGKYVTDTGEIEKIDIVASELVASGKAINISSVIDIKEPQ